MSFFFYFATSPSTVEASRCFLYCSSLHKCCSTDYVFDENGPAPFTVCGASNLLFLQHVLQHFPLLESIQALGILSHGYRDSHLMAHA